MSYTIEIVRRDGSDREDLLDFLMNSPGEKYEREQWRSRLHFWWDANPAAGSDQPWGWTLRNAGVIVGFLGCIPMIYQYQGAAIPAVAATSWRVLEEHRSQSLRLFMPMYKLSQQMLVLNTSPSPAVKQILQRSGFLSQPQSQRHFFVLGRFLGALTASIVGKGRGFPSLQPSLRVVTDVSLVKQLMSPTMQSDRLEKQITPDYLRWQLTAPEQNLKMIGCMDEEGILSSYLVLQPTVLKGLKAWLAVDWFTSRSSTDELWALVGKLSHKPDMIPGDTKARLLAVVSMTDDTAWDAAPAVYRRLMPVKHFYALPTALKGCAKRCVIAEGDCLL